MFDIKEFSFQLQDLIEENIFLRQENERLKEVEQKYKEFVDNQYMATTKVTGAWIEALLKGDMKITS